MGWWGRQRSSNKWGPCMPCQAIDDRIPCTTNLTFGSDWITVQRSGKHSPVPNSWIQGPVDKPTALVIGGTVASLAVGCWWDQVHPAKRKGPICTSLTHHARKMSHAWKSCSQKQNCLMTGIVFNTGVFEGRNRMIAQPCRSTC